MVSQWMRCLASMQDSLGNATQANKARSLLPIISADARQVIFFAL